MGLKTAIKTALMRNIMKKRKAAAAFDEVLSEHYQTPDDAGEDMNNSYYFSAHTWDGGALFVRYAQRGGGDKAMAEVWAAYRAADGTAFVNQNCLYKLSESPMGVKCVTPLREWQFFFKGEMAPVAPFGEELIARPIGEPVFAELSGTFTSKNGLYEFSRETDDMAFCRAVAAEKWKKGFSDDLNRESQTHIEQDGHIKAVLNVGGKEYKIDAQAVRDHSYGRRVWSYMNRHTWRIALLEDGSLLNTNVVRYPALNVRGLKCGYKMKDGVMANVTDVIFHGGAALDGLPLREDEYTVKYSDGSEIKHEFKADIAFPFEFDDKYGKYIIYEGISSFIIGGVKGRGITEFGFNGDKGRYESPKMGD
ncbi:MAG: hypothetical protein FWE84_03530 [Firmicutes bacterium]|nr:hypothetical protein [Bacillota bacterium]